MTKQITITMAMIPKMTAVARSSSRLFLDESMGPPVKKIHPSCGGWNLGSRSIQIEDGIRRYQVRCTAQLCRSFRSKTVTRCSREGRPIWLHEKRDLRESFHTLLIYDEVLLQILEPFCGLLSRKKIPIARDGDRNQNSSLRETVSLGAAGVL